jgi:hypothetical protein
MAAARPSQAEVGASRSATTCGPAGTTSAAAVTSEWRCSRETTKGVRRWLADQARIGGIVAGSTPAGYEQGLQSAPAARLEQPPAPVSPGAEGSRSAFMPQAPATCLRGAWPSRSTAFPGIARPARAPASRAPRLARATRDPAQRGTGGIGRAGRPAVSVPGSPAARFADQDDRTGSGEPGQQVRFKAALFVDLPLGEPAETGGLSAARLAGPPEGPELPRSPSAHGQTCSRPWWHRPWQPCAAAGTGSGTRPRAPGRRAGPPGPRSRTGATATGDPRDPRRQEAGLLSRGAAGAEVDGLVPRTAGRIAHSRRRPPRLRDRPPGPRCRRLHRPARRAAIVSASGQEAGRNSPSSRRTSGVVIRPAAM